LCPIILIFGGSKKMKNFLITFFTVLTIILYFFNNFTKSYDSELQKINKNHENIKIINKFYGINSYLLKINEKPEYILIDTLTPGSEDFIIKSIESNNIKKEQIKLIFLTHVHNDHSGSAHELKKYFNVPVVIHKSEAKYFRENIPIKVADSPYELLNKIMKSMKKYLPKTDVEEIENQDDLKNYGIDFKIINLQAHSLGNLMVANNDGDCIMGDLIPGGFFTLNSPQWSLFYENSDLLNQSIKTLINSNCKWYFPGHGLPYNKESLQIWIKNKNITLN
jgi:hydroxyacylglutathione hydrolase